MSQIPQTHQSLDEQVRHLQDRYNELIMAVETKHEHETRHETALRYIRETEQRHQFNGPVMIG